MKQITILLAEDHAILREGIRSLVEIEKDLKVVGEAENGRQAVNLAEKLRPDVVLMDLAMPELNGLQATAQVLKSVPSTKVLILSARAEYDYVEQAITLGAAGYLLKQTCFQTVVTAIREVSKGKMFFSPSIAKRRGDREKTSVSRLGVVKKKRINLTSREAEILQLVAEGKSNKQAATSLNISIKTVEKHRHNLMVKLDIHDIASLTRYAIETGVIESSVQSTIP